MNSRLVYLSNAILPSRHANSVHVMRMCQAFSNLGLETLLLAPDMPEAESGIDDLYAYYGVERNFEIRKLPWLRMKGRGHIYGFWAAWKSRQARPFAVYSRFLPGAYFAALFGIPAAIEMHVPVEYLGPVCTKMFVGICHNKNFLGLVVISSALKDYYRQKYGIPEDMILVAHDGADPPPEDIAPPSKNTERLQVGYIGHLYPGRGIEIIIEMARRCPWADFHLIGGMEEHLKVWRAESDDISNLKFYGFVPPAAVGEYGRSMHVLLAPYQSKVMVQDGSDTSRWMSPMKLFEYMSYGKAILCSDLPVLREIFANGETALLCEADDVAFWEKALIELRDDGEKRERLGAAAKAHFLEQYTWTRRAERIYREFLLPRIESL